MIFAQATKLINGEAGFSLVMLRGLDEAITLLSKHFNDKLHPYSEIQFKIMRRLQAKDNSEN